MSGFGGMLFGADLFGAGQAAGATGDPVPGMARVVPLNFSAISNTTAITFDIVDDDPGIAYIAGWVKFRSRLERELIYSTESGFHPPFSLRSTVVERCTPGSAGSRQFRFSILPDYRWESDLTEMTWRAADGAGNILVSIDFLDVVCP